MGATSIPYSNYTTLESCFNHTLSAFKHETIWCLLISYAMQVERVNLNALESWGIAMLNDIWTIFERYLNDVERCWTILNDIERCWTILNGKVVTCIILFMLGMSTFKHFILLCYVSNLYNRQHIFVNFILIHVAGC